MIWIASEVYNSDRQLSIMQSLSATTTAATAVQNPSVSELHMVQVRHNREGSSTEKRNQGMHKSCYCCEATPSHPKKECPKRDAQCYKCGKKGHFKGSCMSKKKEKEVDRKKEANKSP